MKIDLESTYPAIIELVLRVPFQKLHVAATLILSQIDERSCVVCFRFGLGDEPMDWPRGIDNVRINLQIRHGAKHANDQKVVESSYGLVIRRKDGIRAAEICYHEGPLFVAMAQYLANHRTSECPLKLDLEFNVEKP